MFPTGITAEAGDYVRTAIADLQSRGVTVTLATDDAEGFGGGKLGGYFDEDGPVFFVGSAPSQQVWLSVFVHEYQHFRQWMTKSPTWSAKLGGDCCAWYVFDAWLQGVVELTPQQRDEALRLILTCERECETMSLAEIEAHPQLGLDPGWYKQAANVYLAWYGVARLSRRWYDRSPYTDPTLLDMMPNDRLITVDEAIRPSPAVVAAVFGKVFTEVS
ncbi:MAG: hypothetical protein ACKOEM_04640 [Planctomycetia bacterium]